MQTPATHPIPPLTAEALEDIDRTANAPGRLGKSWAQLTRVAQERLGAGTRKKPGARTRMYRDGEHYVVFGLAATKELVIEFGRVGPGNERQRLGRLQAHWDELGLTGPYRIAVRGREHSLNTFCVVLEPYLALPEIS